MNYKQIIINYKEKNKKFRIKQLNILSPMIFHKFQIKFGCCYTILGISYHGDQRVAVRFT